MSDRLRLLLSAVGRRYLCTEFLVHKCYICTYQRYSLQMVRIMISILEARWPSLAPRQLPVTYRRVHECTQLCSVTVLKFQSDSFMRTKKSRYGTVSCCTDYFCLYCTVWIQVVYAGTMQVYAKSVNLSPSYLFIQ